MNQLECVVMCFAKHVYEFTLFTVMKRSLNSFNIAADNNATTIAALLYSETTQNNKSANTVKTKTKPFLDMSATYRLLQFGHTVTFPEKSYHL